MGIPLGMLMESSALCSISSWSVPESTRGRALATRIVTGQAAFPEDRHHIFRKADLLATAPRERQTGSDQRDSHHPARVHAISYLGRAARVLRGVDAK
jgi:hypothetical protein